MTDDDALFRFRLRLFGLAAELGNVRAACRAMGVHPSTFYRWRAQRLRFGPKILRPRERRQPRMANSTPVWIEQRVLAFALGHPVRGACGVHSSRFDLCRWCSAVFATCSRPVSRSVLPRCRQDSPSQLVAAEHDPAPRPRRS